MSVARSSLLMASGTVISRVLGFARAVLLAAMIGVTTDAADAFGVANQLPNNVYAIIVGGVLNAVLVPQLVRAHTHTDGGRGYIDRLMTMAIVVFGSITILATAAAPLLVQLYTSGWKPELLALATAFAYWCLPQLFFYGIYSMLGEVLNSRSAFGPYMWAPVLNNVVALAGMVAYLLIFGLDPTGTRAVSSWGSGQITLLAATATAGVAAQALILFVSWRKIGLNFRFNFHWRGFGLRPALKAASWTLAMVIVTQLAGLVQTAVASTAASNRTSMAVASIAAASIAWLIFMLPHSVVTVSIATAYFTKISQHAQAGRIDELKADVLAGLKTIALVSLLATAALVVLAYPAARVFVGEYPATVALGNVIVALMIGLLPFSVAFFLQKAFFALEDTRTPFFITLAQSVLYVIGALVIGATVPHERLVVALSLMTSASVTLQAVLAFVVLRRRIGSLGGGLFVSIARFTFAALVAGAAGWGVLKLLGGVGLGAPAVSTVLGAVLYSGVTALGMLIAFTLALWVIGAPEFKLVAGGTATMVRRVLGRRGDSSK